MQMTTIDFQLDAQLYLERALENATNSESNLDDPKLKRRGEDLEITARNAGALEQAKQFIELTRETMALIREARNAPKENGKVYYSPRNPLCIGDLEDGQTQRLIQQLDTIIDMARPGMGLLNRIRQLFIDANKVEYGLELRTTKGFGLSRGATNRQSDLPQPPPDQFDQKVYGKLTGLTASQNPRLQLPFVPDPMWLQPYLRNIENKLSGAKSVDSREVLETLGRWDQHSYRLFKLEQQDPWSELRELSKADPAELAAMLEQLLDDADEEQSEPVQGKDDKKKLDPVLTEFGMDKPQLVLMDQANRSWLAVDVEIKNETNPDGLKVDLPSITDATKRLLDWHGANVKPSIRVCIISSTDGEDTSTEPDVVWEWNFDDGVLQLTTQSTKVIQAKDVQEIMLVKPKMLEQTLN
jgi:hypothetical protein